MKIMTYHTWFDEDVSYVLRGDGDVQEFVLDRMNRGSLIFSKEDAIQLAKSFGLIVYPKDANL